jgi:predicted RNA binding protein YcfA (HicA-like mRNA interferase family)
VCADRPEDAHCRTAFLTSHAVKPDLLLVRIRRGDITNVSFDDLVRLVLALGFREVGGKGSHRVFAHPGVTELVNLQAERGQAKRYQVRQVAGLVRRYDLSLEDVR